MKKNYIAPAVEIEVVYSRENLMLTISNGEPFEDGEEGTADVNEEDGTEGLWFHYN